MSVLICKNTATEGPGTIEDFLGRESLPCRIVDLSEEQDLPDTSLFKVLIMLGGPMSVNETAAYPYLQAEENLVRDFIAKKKAVLGICLGSQIMAKALGANVYRGLRKEIGWHDIDLTDEGTRDPVMMKLALHPLTGDISRKVKVFHWHGETFDIPQGAKRLASSALYANQAFSYGGKAYALQFHMEVTKTMIYDWLRDEEIDLQKIMMETERLFEVYSQRAQNFYGAFFRASFAKSKEFNNSPGSPSH
ncbi:MAG: type 1 glutamine amidotransferase [Dissulfurispiraceae bacterium]